MNTKQLILIICCTVSSLLLSRCTSPVDPLQVEATGTKTVAVSFGIKTNQYFNEVVKTAYVSVSATDIDTIIRPMTITDSMLYGTVENIPVGKNRLFQIFAYDSLLQLYYHGSQKADLEAGVTTSVMISIGRLSGPVEIIGIIEDTSDIFWYADTMDTLVPPNIGSYYLDTTDRWSGDDTLMVDTLVNPNVGTYYIDTTDRWSGDDTLMVDTLVNPNVGTYYIDTTDRWSGDDTLMVDTLVNPNIGTYYIDTTDTWSGNDTLMVDTLVNPNIGTHYIDTTDTWSGNDTLMVDTLVNPNIGTHYIDTTDVSLPDTVAMKFQAYHPEKYEAEPFSSIEY